MISTCTVVYYVYILGTKYRGPHLSKTLFFQENYLRTFFLQCQQQNFEDRHMKIHFLQVSYKPARAGTMKSQGKPRLHERTVLPPQHLAQETSCGRNTVLGCAHEACLSELL